MGLGMMTELPMVIVNVQRGGPSTGLPTKTEQSDLLLAMFGRNGELPAADRGRGDSRRLLRHGQEAMRIAVEFMTPVILLTDGYIANGAEPWRIPEHVRTQADQGHTSQRVATTAKDSCLTCGMKSWSALGPFPARRAWNIAWADWRKKTSPATWITHRKTMPT